MRLAIIDWKDNILIAWPHTVEAHADIADLAASTVYPRKWQTRKREKLAAAIRLVLVGLQDEVRRI